MSEDAMLSNVSIVGHRNKRRHDTKTEKQCVSQADAVTIVCYEECRTCKGQMESWKGCCRLRDGGLRWTSLVSFPAAFGRTSKKFVQMGLTMYVYLQNFNILANQHRILAICTNPSIEFKLNICFELLDKTYYCNEPLSTQLTIWQYLTVGSLPVVQSGGHSDPSPIVSRNMCLVLPLCFWNDTGFSRLETVCNSRYTVTCFKYI